MSYTAESLVVRARGTAKPDGVVNRVTPEVAQWEHLSAELRSLAAGAHVALETGENEAVVVILGGTVDVTSNRGEWKRVGRRATVFDGKPWALYLPRQTRFAVHSVGGAAEFAWAWAKASVDHEPRLVTPNDSAVELRGGGTASRQINSIVPPGFPCERLVAVEVFTPAGNWSSYPGHKHDEHRVAPDGRVLEADLEEIYLYKFRTPQGWAFQRVYTDDRRLDAAVVAHQNDMVLVPFGYHPVSAPVGHDVYYLNFLAGSAQSLACSDDPEQAFAKKSWGSLDPRVPLVREPT